jgi:small subunit ribosomal protein S4
MGDPKKQVNKYSKPRHPWERDRIADEKKLKYEYGLKNKKEIWKEVSFVKKIKDHVKRLNILTTPQAEIERNDLFKKLIDLNLLKEGQSLDEALEITTRDVMERRLQTQIVRKGLAKTLKQARQFIVHGHIKLGDKRITFPGCHVTKDQQVLIEFIDNSVLVDPEHPERKIPELVKVEEPKETSVDDEVAKELEDSPIIKDTEVEE